MVAGVFSIISMNISPPKKCFFPYIWCKIVNETDFLVYPCETLCWSSDCLWSLSDLDNISDVKISALASDQGNIYDVQESS